MIHKLKPQDYDKVRPLFAGLAPYNGALSALLDGINSGWVLADNVDNPTSAFACSVEGHFLAGDPQNDAFVAAANTYLVENHFNDEPTVSGEAIELRLDSKSWQDKVSALFHPREVLLLPRRHYVCTELKYSDWRERVPDGFTVRPVDDALLDNSDVDIPNHIFAWIKWNWGSRESYRQHGFGYCTVHDAASAIVSWSMADCITRDSRCEIGIQTRSEYRRRGLAAITVAAAVDYAFSHGFTQVGWHCNDDNTGSYKTAERVGFSHERDYVDYYCMFSSVHQLAESGWYHLRNGRAEQSAPAYKQLFALGEDYPAYIYHTAARTFAALNNHETAIRYINVAVDRGWSHIDYTINECPELATLHGTPEWQAILARMRE